MKNIYIVKCQKQNKKDNTLLTTRTCNVPAQHKRDIVREMLTTNKVKTTTVVHLTEQGVIEELRLDYKVGSTSKNDTVSIKTNTRDTM